MFKEILFTHLTEGKIFFLAKVVCSTPVAIPASFSFIGWLEMATLSLPHL